jgi:hypothetical protein
VTENLSEAMIQMYRGAGIFAHENPVRAVSERLEALSPDWIHAMHGGTIAGDSLHYFTSAIRDQDFAYSGVLLGREVGAVPDAR